MFDTGEYREAPSGEGEQASTWKDKPHRLIYDLCTEIERLQAEPFLRSSELVWERKCWGKVQHVFALPSTAMSYLEIESGWRCSRHYHEERVNHFIVIRGSVCVEWWPSGLPIGTKRMKVLSVGDSFTVEVPVWHRFRVMKSGLMVEVYWAKDQNAFVRFDDIVRDDVGGKDDPMELERELEEFGE